MLIVGGGTAGWLTAAYLARALGGAVSITLLEAPELGTIGVGEGTFPTIRETLRFLGIDEAAFVRDAGATFKQGVRFAEWQPPVAGVPHSYFHPFDPPYQGAGLVPHWLRQDARARAPFAEAVSIQQRVAAARRAPKQPGEGDFDGPLHYAFHFDAARLAALLATRARALGVAHRSARLRAVVGAADGGIARVETDIGALTADLYVDCTGFRAEMIGEALRSPFHSVADQLFTDRALTCKIPYDSPDTPLESATVATAHAAGWIWDIGLAGARGIGCVYASGYMGDDAAAETLGRYLGRDPAAIAPRRIAFTPGWRERSWIGNCVAVGLASGFLEPLESTGVVLIEAAAAMIAELLPSDGPVDAPAARFNALLAARYENIAAFLKLHYCLSARPEPFWRDHRDPATIPPRLRDWLDQWRHRPPSRFDFQLESETFAHFNYQYILYGMGYATAGGSADAAATERGERLLARVRTFGERAARELPPHRALVEQLAAAPISPARTGS
ncbi:tryptophan halogenase family protein [Sphingomonas sp. BK235]|uniref:tryptophan halogenase family protein n=1 Tax=Sphingomonas sp. BK235 TaxID=2512131 RepID=UPI0010DDEFCD|nr:flavin-dependent dehydrogenase [Sphingomonas sp. BK235]